MDPALTSRQRGAVVRALAGREHAGPWGAPVSVSRKTIRQLDVVTMGKQRLVVVAPVFR